MDFETLTPKFKSDVMCSKFPKDLRLIASLATAHSYKNHLNCLTVTIRLRLHGIGHVQIRLGSDPH